MIAPGEQAEWGSKGGEMLRKGCVWTRSRRTTGLVTVDGRVSTVVGCGLTGLFDRLVGAAQRRIGGRNVTLEDGKVRVLAAAQLQGTVVDAAYGPKMDDGEHGLGEQIQDAVEDHLAGRTDDVAAVSETPSDGWSDAKEQVSLSCMLSARALSNSR